MQNYKESYIQRPQTLQTKALPSHTNGAGPLDSSAKAPKTATARITMATFMVSLQGVYLCK